MLEVRNRKTVAAIVLIPVVIALAVMAFVWPNARLQPRELPVGVAGPPNAAAQLAQRLGERGGAFDVTTYATEDAARTAIEERDVYGAFVATPEGPKVLTASAASPVVAQLLTAAAAENAPSGARSVVDDVVAAPEEDPRGSAFGSSVLPLALAGVISGAGVTLLGLRGSRAVVALVGAACGIGLVGAAITDSWLGVLDGTWWAEAGAFALTALAGSAVVAGLAAVLGTAGIGLGAVINVFLGNPFSGVTTAPEMLPEPVGMLGQWLPVGSGGQLLRSVAFFDGNAASGPALTLGAWTLAGLCLVLLGRGRRGGTGAAEGPGEAVEARPAMAGQPAAGQRGQ
ncbi:ABC transporter permease [Streptomyces coelicoflavus]|uniref:ABC transporter permease n=1 Tax=Streptomyces coelicoflavus TaxID=285562 RepID=UPI00369B66EC